MTPNGIRYATYGETNLPELELERMVQAVPGAVGAALNRKVYYFVPLTMSDRRSDPNGKKNDEATVVAPVYSEEFSDQAICHRNVALGETEGIFISTRLLSDRFALAFEFFINVAHGFVEATGIPASFEALVWAQAVADVRGETSQDSWESRNQALSNNNRTDKVDGQRHIDEKAKTAFVEAAFADAVAIYQLSLSVDFDYSELREREYPLLAPQQLAERLRAIAKLFPPNPGYEFAIRYRKRA
jgi:hypothetical protein